MATGTFSRWSRCAPHRRRVRRAARPDRGRLPAHPPSTPARGLPPHRPAGRPAGLRPRRTAGGRGREDDQRPVRRPGQRGPGLLRHSRPDGAVHISGHFSSFFGEGSGHEDHDDDERVGALSHPFGKQQVPAERVVAGDIAAIGRLTRAETGDTLSSVDSPRVLRPWPCPTPLLPVAIEAATKSDEDKLSSALSRLAAEDPITPHRAQRRDPASWCCGRWASRTPTWPSTGCGPGSASASSTAT